MITTIHLAVSDQLLTANIVPPLASGDVNTVRLRVDTDMYWLGYTISAVFFTSKNSTPYEVILDEKGECLVPPEVLVEPCMLYIGLRGVHTIEDLVKTTSIVKAKVREGTPTNIVAEPTIDLYKQLVHLASQAVQITPVKGVHYWTEADKAEIKAYVDDAILNGEW